MQCREVRRCLNEGGAISPQVREHLVGCPKCAREFEAARILDQALDAAGTADALPATPLARLRSRVVARENQAKSQEKNIMSIFTRQINRRPRFSFGFAILVAAVLFMTMVPFSYERTTGYEAAFENLPAGTDVSPLVQEALVSLGYNDAAVTALERESRYHYLITGLQTREDAREAAAVFATITGTDRSPRIEAITESVSGSLYAQVRDGLIRIEIDAENKSDAEIEDEIAARLTEYGFGDVQVQVSTAADGSRQMNIFIGDDGSDPDKKKEQRIELQMQGDPNDTIAIEMGPNVPDEEIDQLIEDNKHLSDAELEALLEAEFDSRGLPEADVTVSTNADGEREIGIEVQKRKWITDN
jgi:hypothetical protein